MREHYLRWMQKARPDPGLRASTPADCAKLIKRIIENEMLNGEEIQLDGAIRLTPK